ncbi:MAG: helix-turn-helix domain-containing protein [Tepidiformaceae bacterium]
MLVQKGRVARTRHPADVTADQLTRRESEVLSLLGERLTNREIAANRVISVRTVESHVANILQKVGASDRRHAGQLWRDGRISALTTDDAVQTCSQDAVGGGEWNSPAESTDVRESKKHAEPLRQSSFG